jgi:hypothetical protein
MRDIHGIEEVNDRLRPHWPKIQEHFDAENERFKALMAGEHDALGRVLKCHLIVEHYMDQFLEQHFHLEHLAEAKLTFFQKATLLPTRGTTAAVVKPGILKLNWVRNQYGHNLAVEIDQNKMRVIDDLLAIMRPDTVFESLADRIEAFTTVACVCLLEAPPGIARRFQEAFADFHSETIKTDSDD